MPDSWETVAETEIGSCVTLSMAAGYLPIVKNGLSIFEVPYTYCTNHCTRITPMPGWAVYYVLFQFILPAMIFSTAVTRRWYLDLPMPFMRFEHSIWLKMIQVPICLVGFVIARGLDMILWIGLIFAFAGPIVSSSIQEMLLDYRVLKSLRQSNAMRTPLRHIDQEKRKELITALLCAGFEDKTKGVHKRAYDELRINPSTDEVKTYLRLILTSQPDYTTVIGLPAIFFVGGFVYNSLNTSAGTATGAFMAELGVWWLAPVFVAVACGMTLIGLNPATVSVLIKRGYQAPEHSWNPLRDYYDAEAYPVWVWDRGRKKSEAIAQTVTWNNYLWFRRKVRLGYGSWTIIIATASTVVFAPTALAISMDLFQGQERQTCASLSYYLYMGCQAWMIVVSALRAATNQPYRTIFKPRLSCTNLQKFHWTLQYFFCYLELFFLSMLGLITALALAVSFTVVFMGNIAQIYGLYDDCLCSTPLDQWILPPSLRRTVLGSAAFELAAFADQISIADHITWGAAATLTFICYLGWLYQRLLRNAIASQIAEL